MFFKRSNFLKFSIALYAAVTLVGCGGSSSSPQKPVEKLPLHLVLTPKDYTVLSQVVDEQIPFYIRNENPGDEVIENQPDYTKNNWAYFVRHMGSNAMDFDYFPTVNTLQTTGVDLANIPVKGNNKGSYTRASYNTFESFIDTTTFPAYDIRGAGPHTVLSLEMNQPAINFGIKGSFKVPKIDIVGEGVSQLSLAVYLKNKVDLTQGPIGFVNLISESRETGVNFKPYVGHDTYTFFVSQPIHENVFATPIMPHKATHLPFTESKEFGFVITRENMQNILNQLQIQIDKDKPLNSNLKDIDLNPENYEVVLAGVLHEDFIFNNPAFVAKSGYSVQNLQTFRLN